MGQPGPGGRIAQGQALQAGDAAARVGDQLAGGGLGEHAGAGAADGGGQAGIQQPAGGAAAPGPVASRRGRRPGAGLGSGGLGSGGGGSGGLGSGGGGSGGGGSGGGGQFAAGVVEVVAVGRVRGLVRAEAPLERNAVTLEPGQHGHAAVAELAERRFRHRVADLGTQVAEHRLGRVGDARRALLRGAAAGVDNAAGQRGGPAAAEPVQDQHRAAGRGRLQGGAGTRGAEADHHHVGLDVPVRRHGASRGSAQNCNVF